MFQEQPDKKVKSFSNTVRRLSPKELLATHNPALARLATTIMSQDNVVITNYSRMHHRHSRN